jgi:hypothetical protein
MLVKTLDCTLVSHLSREQLTQTESKSSWFIFLNTPHFCQKNNKYTNLGRKATSGNKRTS